MDDFPNDYSNPRAIESGFLGVNDRLDDLEEKVSELERVSRQYHSQKKESASSSGGDAWIFGSALAIVLSWSRNASILYCIGHGIASWIYVIYFALTR
jgi:hypothetical protein